MVDFDCSFLHSICSSCVLRLQKKTDWRYPQVSVDVGQFCNDNFYLTPSELFTKHPEKIWYCERKGKGREVNKRLGSVTDQIGRDVSKYNKNTHVSRECVSGHMFARAIGILKAQRLDLRRPQQPPTQEQFFSLLKVRWKYSLILFKRPNPPQTLQRLSSTPLVEKSHP